MGVSCREWRWLRGQGSHVHELPGGHSAGGQWRKLWDGGPAQCAWILLGGLAVQLDLEGSGDGEVHSREHALEWPYTRIDQPKPRPGPASPALGLPTPPSGCGSGLGSAVRGLCVAAATPPSVWREAWTPREPSSTRSAPSKVQVGDGARAGGRGPGCDLWLGAAHRRAAVRVCRPGDSFGRRELEPQKPQAHASPGYHASPGLTGCMCVWGDSSRSPAASVGGAGQAAAAGAGRRWELAVAADRPLLPSVTLPSPYPACRPAAKK